MHTLTLVVTLIVAVGICYSEVPVWKKLTENIAYTIAVNPLNSNSIIVGTTGGNILLSHNAGTEFITRMAADAPAASGVSSVLWSSADTNVVLAGGYSLNGIWKSTDAGNSFTRVHTAGTQAQWFVSDAIIEDPSHPRTVYAVRFNIKNHIYRSTDLGDTWDTLATISSQLAPQLCTIAARTDSSNILFIGARSGKIFRSIDSGRTWATTKVTRDNANLPPTTEIPKIIFSRNNPLIGYAVAYYANPSEVGRAGGLLYTSDGGTSWEIIAQQDTSLWAVAEYHQAGKPTQLFTGGFANVPNITGPGLLATFQNNVRVSNPFEPVEWGTNSQGLDSRNVWMFKQAQPYGAMYMGTSNGLFVLSNTTSVHEPSGATGVAIQQKGSDVSIEALNSSLGFRWQLYTLQGVQVSEAVVTASSTRLSLLDKPTGVYLVRVTQDNSVQTATLIVSP